MKSCDVSSKVKLSGVPNYVARIIYEYAESKESPEQFFVEHQSVFHEAKTELEKFERGVFCWISNYETI
jgi:hypothetical protein